MRLRLEVVCRTLGAVFTGVWASTEAARAQPPAFVREWGAGGSAPGEFDRPRGIAAGTDGRLYVSDDTSHRVQVFDRDGNYLLGWGGLGNAPGQFDEPLGLDVDGQGHVFVVDSNNFRIQQFTASGDFVGLWGTFGDSPGEFVSPADLVLDEAGRVYVTDGGRGAVLQFDSQGNFLAEFRCDSSNQPIFKAAPFYIAYDGQGHLFVTDTTGDEVVKLSTSGEKITSWGGMGTFPGAMNTPLGLDVDPDGNLFVADHHNFRIQKFTSDGTFLLEFGTRGTGPNQFVALHDLVVDDAGDLFIIDLENEGFIQHFDSNPVGIERLGWGRFKALFRTSP